MLKKLFALGLATVMALGTTMSAFAAEPDVGTNTTRAHDMEQKKVLVGSIQKTIPVLPKQLSEGYASNKGSWRIYFNANGGNVITYTVQLSKGPVSITFDSGKETEKVSGYSMLLPNDGVHYYGLFYKTYKIDEYEIYERPAGSTQPFTLAYTDVVKKEIGITFDQVTKAELREIDYVG